MSLFCEFHKAWRVRFPSSELPAAWEEDVRANLTKRRAKVALLQEELEKEQFYVGYLEKLLQDVSDHRRCTEKEDERGEGEGREASTSSVLDFAVTEALNNALVKTRAPPESSKGSVKALAQRFGPSAYGRSTSLPAEDEFVTVIPVEGARPRKIPPLPPPKNFKRPASTSGDLRSETVLEEPPLLPTRPLLEEPRVPNACRRSVSKSSSNASSLAPGGSSAGEDLGGSGDITDDEPLYDTVAPDDAEEEGGVMSDTLKSGGSSEGLPANATPSPMGSQRPPDSNYVNIDFFLKKKKLKSESASAGVGLDDSEEDEIAGPLLSGPSSEQDEDEDEEDPLDIDSGVFGSSVESASHLAASCSPVPKKKLSSSSFGSDADAPPVNQGPLGSVTEAERLAMFRCIVSSIVESETVYLDCLEVVLQYMKALKATLTTSQPLISSDDYSTVFYRVLELHTAHNDFLSGLREYVNNWNVKNEVGELFRNLAQKLDCYAQFLQNYPRAIETVRKCSNHNPNFASITRSIKLKSLQGQPQSLEDLLHRPVARVQKNALVLHDLLKYTDEGSSDHEALKDALKLTQNFLSHLSMIHTEAMFPVSERPQRHLIRNSFIVELVDGHRKLRHLFLFNDTIVCAKYKANTPGVGGSSLTLQELQNWIMAYRSYLRMNMGSFLLKSARDESLLLGDLHIVISNLYGLTSPSSIFLCFEVDSYGHFFRKAKTRTCEGIEPHWNQDFIIELEGSQTLRILCYEDHQLKGPVLKGKAEIELSRSWLNSTLTERRVGLQDFVLTVSMKFLPPEATLRRVPAGKSLALFGAPISTVCRRERRSVPFVITRCVREVERRGIQEIGIYRVSGLTSDISRLRKSFETNPYEAEQLVKDVDIHSVTGLLKLYLRELPEALFTDELYPRFFEAFSSSDGEYKRMTLLRLFSSLPQFNQSVIVYLLEHLVKINEHESINKMSLHNLATIFGPTMIRPGVSSANPTPAEELAAGTVDVMAQAGILHFFLKRRTNKEPIQGVLN